MISDLNFWATVMFARRNKNTPKPKRSPRTCCAKGIKEYFTKGLTYGTISTRRRMAKVVSCINPYGDPPSNPNQFGTLIAHFKDHKKLENKLKTQRLINSRITSCPISSSKGPKTLNQDYINYLSIILGY